MNEQNKKEVCQEMAQNLVAAKTIYDNYQATFKQIAEKDFMPIIKDYCKDVGLKEELDSASEGYICFSVRKKQWEDLAIWFWYENPHKYFYGLYTKNEELSMQIQEKANALKESNNEEVKQLIQNVEYSWYYPLWFQLESLDIDKWQKDIVKSHNFAQDCIQKMKDLLAVVKELEIG